jgi:hypothetical protein
VSFARCVLVCGVVTNAGARAATRGSDNADEKATVATMTAVAVAAGAAVVSEAVVLFLATSTAIVTSFQMTTTPLPPPLLPTATTGRRLPGDEHSDAAAAVSKASALALCRAYLCSLLCSFLGRASALVETSIRMRRRW